MMNEYIFLFTSSKLCGFLPLLLEDDGEWGQTEGQSYWVWQRKRGTEDKVHCFG